MMVIFMRITKIRYVLIIIAVFAVLIVFNLMKFYFIPNYKYDMNYVAPQNLSAEETVRFYFQSLDECNPAKANTVLINPTLSKYSCSKLLNLKIKNIEMVNKVDDSIIKKYFDYKEFFVEYNSTYLFGDSKGQVLEGTGNCLNFYLVKETETSDWKIHSWGLG